MGLTDDEMRWAWMALAHAGEPADAALGRLVHAVGPIEALDRIRHGRSGLRHQEGLATRLGGLTGGQAEEQAAAMGIRIITPGDHEWPSQVGDLGMTAPLAMWLWGAADLRLLALRSLAIVGARACTLYGEETTRSWAAELASEGWAIVSGAALGIDAAAHRGALAAGGVTLAVMAGGVDVAYPRAHAPLLAAIADQGLIVSEVPLGETVRRQRFLSRNRLIAALARATLVIEAADRSGTSATARAAHQMGRSVLALPGPVTSPASIGCHRMIQDGLAMLVADLDDVRSAVDLTSLPPVPVPAAPMLPFDQLHPREARVLDGIPSRGWIDAEGLVRACGLGVADVLTGVALLVAAGLLEEGADGWRLPRASPLRSAGRLSG